MARLLDPVLVSAPGGRRGTLRVAVVALALLLACGGRGEALSEAEKRQRVDRLFERAASDFPEVPTVTPEELEERRQRGEPAVLVDVRSEAERTVSMLPGAITAAELEAHPERYRDRLVVTYCTIGVRSGESARQLLAEGWRAANLEGSLLGWTHRGLPLVTPAGEGTRRVHVYGPRWDLAASGYQAVW